MTKPRPLLGYVLFLAALFLEGASRSGVVGRWVARAAIHLFGGYGTTLIALGLGGAGLAVAVPQWFWRSLAAAGRGVRRLLARVARRLRKLPARNAAPSEPIPIARKAASPIREPAKLAEVRGGLRYLGYSAPEITEALKQIDTRRGTEDLIRDALKVLRIAA